MEDNQTIKFLIKDFIQNGYNLKTDQEKIIDELIGDAKETKLNIAFIGEAGCGK